MIERVSDNLIILPLFLRRGHLLFEIKQGLVSRLQILTIGCDICVILCLRLGRDLALSVLQITILLVGGCVLMLLRILLSFDSLV